MGFKTQSQIQIHICGGRASGQAVQQMLQDFKVLSEEKDRKGREAEK